MNAILLLCLRNSWAPFKTISATYLRTGPLAARHTRARHGGKLCTGQRQLQRPTKKQQFHFRLNLVWVFRWILAKLFRAADCLSSTVTPMIHDPTHRTGGFMVLTMSHLAGVIRNFRTTTTVSVGNSTVLRLES